MGVGKLEAFVPVDQHLMVFGVGPEEDRFFPFLFCFYNLCENRVVGREYTTIGEVKTCAVHPQFIIDEDQVIPGRRLVPAEHVRQPRMDARRTNDKKK